MKEDPVSVLTTKDLQGNIKVAIRCHLKSPIKTLFIRRKALLILLIFLVFGLFLIVASKYREKNISSLTLVSQQNKFKLNFDIKNRDQDKLSTVLKKLNLPQSVTQGVEFEMDATSEAKLTFISPIKAFFEISPKRIGKAFLRIDYRGSIDTPLASLYQVENIKIPATSNLAAFGSSFNWFLKARFKLSDEFSNWLDKNLTSEKGQYLIIFGEDANFVIIFESDSLDFEGLKNIKIPQSEESLYKEESQDSITFHLLQLPQEEESRQLTATFFRKDKWFYFASSYEAAQEFIKIQDDKENSIIFPIKNQISSSMIVLFRKTDENSPSENFFDLVFDKQKQSGKMFENIDQFEFTLKTKDFSGLINLK